VFLETRFICISSKILASYKEGSWIRLIGQILGLGSAALGLMSQFGSRTSRTVLGANDSLKRFDSTERFVYESVRASRRGFGSRRNLTPELGSLKE